MATMNGPEYDFQIINGELTLIGGSDANILWGGNDEIEDESKEGLEQLRAMNILAETDDTDSINGDMSGGFAVEEDSDKMGQDNTLIELSSLFGGLEEDILDENETEIENETDVENETEVENDLTGSKENNIISKLSDLFGGDVLEDVDDLEELNGIATVF